MEIYHEAHWVQGLTALFLTLGSFLFLFIRTNSNLYKLAGVFGLALLALDEYFMIHECLKGYLRNIVQFPIIKDPFPVFYLLAGGVGLWVFRREIFKRKIDFLYVLIFAGLGSLATFCDTYDFFLEKRSLVIEEISELFLSFMLLVFTMSNLKKLQLSVIVTRTLVWLLSFGGAYRYLLLYRSYHCPSLVKFFY